MELNDAVVEQFDVESALGFAEHVLTNAARLWLELNLDQKQQLQSVLFPEGLRFDGEKFGTAVTCLAFKQLAEKGTLESGWRPYRDSVLERAAKGRDGWWMPTTSVARKLASPPGTDGCGQSSVPA